MTFPGYTVVFPTGPAVFMIIAWPRLFASTLMDHWYRTPFTVVWKSVGNDPLFGYPVGGRALRVYLPLGLAAAEAEAAAEGEAAEPPPPAAAATRLTSATAAATAALRLRLRLRLLEAAAFRLRLLLLLLEPASFAAAPARVNDAFAAPISRGFL